MRSGDGDEEDTAKSEGLPPYIGYEYQILVTVWVALELIFKRGLPHIEIEPASQEDIEAQLNVNREEASAIFRVETLAIQVKFRSSEWKPTAFRELLWGKVKKLKGKKGPAPRERAGEALNADPLRGYLLITNAQLAPTLQSLREAKITALPANRVLPKEVAKGTEGEAVKRRIAVLAEAPSELVTFKIRELLANRLHVPTVKTEECLQRLIGRVRNRLLGIGSKLWTRGEIVGEAQQFGGSEYPTSALDTFVPPRNLKKIEQQLASRHVVVLVGKTGAGKTLTAQFLGHQLSTPEGPEDKQQTVFKICHATGGPQEVWKELATPGAVLFIIEDPWGRSRSSGDAGKWVSELRRLLREARADKKFIITSRQSILEDAGDWEDVKHFCIRIDYEHYDEKARRRILTSMLREAEPWQSRLVSESAGRIVDELRAPLSLQKFAERLTNATSSREVSLSLLIKESGVEVLADLVEREIRLHTWNAIPEAVVLWSLLCDTPTFTHAAMEQRVSLVRQGVPVLASQLQVRLLAWWMAGERWLEADSAGTSYRAHPTTIQGLEKLIKGMQGAERAQGVLEPLLSGLIANGQVADALSIAENLRDRQNWIPADVRDAIARSVRARLLADGEREFREAFFAAVRWLDGRDPVSLMVQALATMSKPTMKGFSAVQTWHRPEWTDAEWQSVLASGEARQIAERHIRQVVPYRQEDFLSSVLDRPRWLATLWDLSNVYAAVLDRSLEGQAHGTPELALGATLANRDSFDGLVAKVLRGLDEIEQEYAAHRQEVESSTRPPSARDEDVADYFWEESRPYRSALEALVAERLKSEGHDWLVTHPRRESLLDSWSHALLYRAKETSREEMQAFFAACRPARLGLAARTIRSERWHPIVPELIATLGEVRQDDLQEYLETLALVVSPEELKTMLEASPPLLSEIQRAGIVLISRRAHVESAEKGLAFRKAVETTLLPDREAILNCCERANRDEAIEPPRIETLRPEDLRALREWAADPASEPGHGALVTLAAKGEPILELVRPSLDHPDDGARLAAVRALAQHPEGEARQLLLRALGDSLPQCRSRALLALASSATPDERRALLKSARWESSDTVRLEYVQAIRQHRWREGVEVLCEFLRDEVDWVDDPSGEEVEHRIAREAASALVESRGELAPDVIQQLLEFVRKGADANSDPVVHERVCELLAELSPAELPSILLDVAMPSEEAPRQRSNPRALRFNALWILHELVQKSPAEGLKFLQPIVELAKLQDAWLSGLAVMTLGLLVPGSWEASIPLFAATEDQREAKAFLMLCSASSRGVDVQGSAAATVLPTDHPARPIPEWLSAPLPKSVDAWREVLKAHPHTRDWLWELQGGDAWEFFLWRACCYQLGDEFERSFTARDETPATM